MTGAKSHPFALAMWAPILARTLPQPQQYPLAPPTSVYSTSLISLEFARFSQPSTTTLVLTITFSHLDGYLGPYLGSLPPGLALSTRSLTATREFSSKVNLAMITLFGILQWITLISGQSPGAGRFTIWSLFYPPASWLCRPPPTSPCSS